MTTAVAYCRVSTDAQGDKNTVENQLDAIRHWAIADGCDLIAEFADEGVSGATPFEERPAAQRLIALAEAGGVQKVIIYDASRLARDVTEAGLALRVFTRLKVEPAFVTLRFDDTPEGEMQFNILMSFAQYDRKIRRRVTMAGRNRHVREGQYMASAAPYGYQRDGKTIALDETESAVVRRMFKWALTDGLGAIVDRLIAEGVEPRRTSGRHAGHKAKGCTVQHDRAAPWHTSAVARILTAPRYIGANTYGPTDKAKAAERLAMTCPVIVDEETFYAVQEALTARRALATGSPRDDFLRGVLICRRCGKGGRGATGKTGLLYYECGHRRRDGASASAVHAGAPRRWPAADVDLAVRKFVLALIADPAAALRRAKLTVDETAAERRERQADKAKAAKSLTGLDAERQRLVTRFAQGGLTDDDLTAQTERIAARRAELEATIAAPEPVSDKRLRAIVAEIIAARSADWREYAAALKAHGIKPGPMTERWLDGTELRDHWLGLLHKTVRAVYLEDDGSVSIEGVFSASTAPSPSLSSR